MLCRVRGINDPILQWYKDLEPWWDTAALRNILNARANTDQQLLLEYGILAFQTVTKLISFMMT